MQRERATLNELLPGLDAELSAMPLGDLECARGPGLKLFKDARGPALLVPVEHSGLGADAVSAVRVQRAIASRSPSLAIATTMHHFSIASLVDVSANAQGLEWMLLQAIAEGSLLVASGFAEGRTGQAILSPTMRAKVRGGKVVINGSKKPCSLAHSMDLLTASVALPTDEGERMAVALVGKDSPGLQVRPFWNNAVLAGAESDEVVLTDVEVPMDLVVRTEITPDQQLDELQTAGFVWFELLMSACYIGVASALVERVLLAGKVNASLRAGVFTDIEAAMRGVEGVARAISQERAGQDALVDALVCRYHAQDTIGLVVRQCVEALGGMAYISSNDVTYLAAASTALAFHPPSRGRMAEPLCGYIAGGPLSIV
ncbi:acyl-CoA dehydrogenase family protein [Pseudonocardia aurantiaca]